MDITVTSKPLFEVRSLAGAPLENTRFFRVFYNGPWDRRPRAVFARGVLNM